MALEVRSILPCSMKIASALRHVWGWSMVEQFLAAVLIHAREASYDVQTPRPLPQARRRVRLRSVNGTVEPTAIVAIVRGCLVSSNK